MKIVLSILVVVVILILAGIAFVNYKSSKVEDKKNLQEVIDKHCQSYINNGNSYGLFVGIIKNGQIYYKGYGTIKKGEQILPDSNSIFELASTSKLFTTSTLQLLIDERKLNVNDKIQTVLGPTVKVPEIAQNTTLQHLATHLSGFPSLPNSFLAKMTDESNPYKDLVKQDLYDYLKTCEGKQPDGTFEYSNFGMGLLGHLLELKTGIGYEALVKQKLLLPLKMEQTFVTPSNTQKTKIVQGYDKKGNETPIWTDNVLTGAGSFLSNGSDMIKFIKANLAESASPVSASLIKTHQEQSESETGLGWILPSGTDKFLGNKSIVWHNGMAGGYASFLVVDKVNNYGIILLSNKAVDVTKLGMKLTIATRTQSWRQ